MYCCEKCGKKLIKRKTNGTWVFKFGKRNDEAVVYMEIVGSIRMRCTRTSCSHINVLNFFPNIDTEGKK